MFNGYYDERECCDDSCLLLRQKGTCLWNVQGYNDVTRDNEPISVTFDRAQDMYGHSPRQEVDALWMPRVVDILVLAG